MSTLGKTHAQMAEIVEDKLRPGEYTKSDLTALLGVTPDVLDSTWLSPSTVSQETFVLQAR